MAQIVTITNPLTGQPAQVDQLDHTAQQIDDGLNIARGVSNPNLLDNWYFGNPVDQRQGRVVKPNTTYYSDNQLTTAAGTTGAYVTAYRYATGTANGVNYASFKLEDKDTAPTYYAAPENVVRGYTGAGYTIDRWKNANANCLCTITDNGLSFGSTRGNVWIQQFIEAPGTLFGLKATISMLLSDGTLYSATGTLPTASVTSNTGFSSNGNINVGLYKTANRLAFFQIGNLSGNSITIKASKLELGDHQTLAHQDENGVWQLNEIPNYGEQLARCQRYAYKLFDLSIYGRAGLVVAEGSDIAHLYIPTPVTMREIPSLQFLHGSISDLYLARSGVYTPISGISCIDKLSGYLDILLNTSGGLTEGNAYTVRVAENRVCILAISEL